jgi:hypothetical protein
MDNCCQGQACSAPKLKKKGVSSWRDFMFM